MSIRYIPILIYFILFQACHSESIPTEPDEIIGEEDAVDNVLQQEMTAAINAARGQARTCGSQFHEAVPPISWNDQLAAAAREHSVDMANNNHFSHQGTDGSSPGDRIERQGYSAITWGENIAAGYGDVERVVNGWLESPGHCSNIMNGSFRELGAGFAENENTQYGIFWTQVFATSR